jgi:patatin-like phospholipase
VANIAPRPELIWMALDPTIACNLEAFTHLLAGAVAEDLFPKQDVALVTVRANLAYARKWTTAGTFGPPTLIVPPITNATLGALIGFSGTPPAQRGRVFVIHVDDPLHRPPIFSGGFLLPVTFHRVVYVTGRIPTAVRSELQALLDPSVMGESTPYFTAVVPSLLTTPPTPKFPWSWLPNVPGAPRFRVRQMQDEADLSGSTPSSIEQRLFRDACRIGMDAAAIQAQWVDWGGGPTPPFVDYVVPSDKQRARRWGRAVTNRRVGVAVSGGGASAYRVIALLEQLEPQIPVDVLSGLSGGSLLGAFFAEGGLEGLKRAADLGPLLQVVLPIVFLSSWPIELVIDVLMGARRIQDLDVRFVPVTTELPPTGPPDTAIVTGGTIGTAVRASCTLPPAFAPMRRNGNRYTDGGAAAIVPAQLVRDCGADLSISCNVIPGARESNPLDLVPVFGALLHDWTVLGRVIDLWTWYTYMWSQASRRFGEMADVYLEFTPQQIPFIECFAWAFATLIATKAGNDPQLSTAMGQLIPKWMKLQNP